MFRLPRCKAGPRAIEQLADVMHARRDQFANGTIPAGFTYLAQFIDHDITSDPTPILERRVDPHALVNFRTPRLDLDSLYGSGPRVHPFLYDWETEPKGARLLVGGNQKPDQARVDLPRNEQGRALIGDARNDENLIVSQLHLLFIRFHNAVVDHLCRKGIPTEQAAVDELLERAQRTVRWHYQWIVVNEFLPLVLGEETAMKVLPSARAPRGRRRYYRPRRGPFIPVEFSGAAYRFGHSMVRKRYETAMETEFGKRIFPALEGSRWLPAELEIAWPRFFKVRRQSDVQPSQRIDTSLVEPLFKDMPDGGDPLALRNLRRGAELGLPSGQAVAERMGLAALPQEALKLDACAPRAQKVLLADTPLWYYVLCEAESGGGNHLGPVGGRIVAEVLTGLLAADPFSYLGKQPNWTPRSLGTAGRFTMAHLVKIAEGGVPKRPPP
jgi:hypothetical protein